MLLPRGPILVAAIAAAASLVPTGVRGQQAEQRGWRIVVDSTERAAARTLTELLSSRVPGLLVQEASGTTGTWSRIWLRGPSSILLESEPLFIVDGVRVLSAPSTTLELGGQLPTRIDDIAVEDIETIEVLPGPSSAAIYGTGAAGGVIRITTRRGREEGLRLSSFIEGGLTRDYTSFPANYQQLGTNPVGGLPTVNCTIDAQARNQCDPTPAGLIWFNPIEAVPPHRSGSLLSAGLGASGGRGWFRYYGGVGLERSGGVFENSDLDREHARLNLDALPRRDLRLSFSGSFASSDARFPSNDASILGPITAGMIGDAVDDPERRGYRTAPPSELATRESGQKLERIGGSVGVHWSPFRWLAMSAMAGTDRSDIDERQLDPPEAGSPLGGRSFGSLTLERSTIGGSVLLSYPLVAGLRASSSIGAELTDDELESRRRFELGGIFSIEEEFADAGIRGLYVEQRLSWRERVHLSLGVRDDEIEAFGSKRDLDAYPWAALAWAVDREEFFPRSDLVTSLRLHAAYGQAGHPATVFSRGSGPVPVQGPVERASELEIGFDAGLMRDRAAVSLSFYDTRARDVLTPLGFSFPPRLGTETKVSNRGIEALVRVGPVAAGGLALSLVGGAWFNRNEVEEYAEDAPPIIFGTGRNQQRIQRGTVLGGYWQQPILGFQDINGDGIISRINCQGGPQEFGGPACEVFLGDTAVFLGSPFPKREITLAPRVSWHGLVELSALLDHRGGFAQFNGSEAVRCGDVQNCRAIQDATAPLAEQARAVALLLGSAAGYVEDASFWKLREVAVSLEAPASWASRVRLRGARLTIAGRNLATWSDYSGLDPEVSGPRSLTLERLELFTQPPVRHFTARLGVTW